VHQTTRHTQTTSDDNTLVPAHVWWPKLCLAVDCTLTTLDAAIAQDCDANPSWLEQTARDNDDLGVLVRVAQNPSTPPATLDWLARNHDFESVADNPSTPAATLRWLWTAYDVGFELLENPATPWELRLEIILSGDMTGPTLDRVIARTPWSKDLLVALDDHGWPVGDTARAWWSGNPDALTRQAVSDSAQERHIAAASLWTPPHILWALAADPDSNNRSAVGSNPSSPQRALDELAHASEPPLMPAISAVSNPASGTDLWKAATPEVVADSTIGSGRLGSLSAPAADIAVGLAADWHGTMGDLLDCAATLADNTPAGR
jgi:hypothetical protein